MKTRYLLFVIISLFIFNGNLKSQIKSKLLHQKVDQLFKKWDTKDSPGMAVGIVHNNKLIFKKGYGLANLENKKSITAKTVFNTASCAKQFTAYAIHVLADQGKLSFDDDIRKYLPDMPQFDKVITIKNLIYHTSGLKNYHGLFAIKGVPINSNEDMVWEVLKKQKALNTPVGEKWVYSNTGYFLLAQIVEKISGQSFGKWTAENIFRPLGMKSSHFLDESSKIPNNIAYPNGDKSQLEFQTLGSTGLYSNIEDLGKWFLKWEEQEFKPNLERMLIKGKLNNGKEIFYASGLGIGSYRNYKTIGHSGNTSGYNSYMEYYPELKLGIIVLNNLDAFNPQSVSRQITDIFLTADSLISSTQNPNDLENKTNIDPSIINNYLGTFEVKQLGMLFNFIMEDDVFAVEASDMGKARLFHESGTKFLVEGTAGGSVTFKTNKETSETKVIITMDGQEFTAERSISSLSEEERKKYTGIYTSDELSCSIKLTVNNNQLFAELDNKETIGLHRIEGMNFLSKHPWVTRFKFIENKNHQIIGMTVDSSNAFRNYFKKQ